MDNLYESLKKAAESDASALESLTAGCSRLYLQLKLCATWPTPSCDHGDKYGCLAAIGAAWEADGLSVMAALRAAATLAAVESIRPVPPDGVAPSARAFSEAQLRGFFAAETNPKPEILISAGPLSDLQQNREFAGLLPEHRGLLGELLPIDTAPHYSPDDKMAPVRPSIARSFKDDQLAWSLMEREVVVRDLKLRRIAKHCETIKDLCQDIGARNEANNILAIIGEHQKE